VHSTCGDSNGGGFVARTINAHDGHGSGAVQTRASGAKLARLIVSPTLDGAGRIQRAAVDVAGSDRAGLGKIQNL